MIKLSQVLPAMAIVLLSFNSMAEDSKVNRVKHPRRRQVIERAQGEKSKNNQAAVDGKITDAQAKKLDHKDNKIELNEELDAKKHGGFITKKEQKQLNREENSVNRERAHMEKHDAEKGTTNSPINATPPTSGR